MAPTLPCAWSRVNKLLSTKERIVEALLAHLLHVHSTMPQGAKTQVKLVPGELRLLLQQGSRRATITTPKGKRFEVRLTAPEEQDKVRQLLSEYVWANRDYSVLVKSTHQPPTGWLHHAKEVVVGALCDTAPDDLAQRVLFESDRNEVLYYSLVYPQQKEPLEFCVGHEALAGDEECEQSDDVDDDEDDEDGEEEEEEGVEGDEGGLAKDEYDEIATMLQMTPVPQAAPPAPSAREQTQKATQRASA